MSRFALALVTLASLAGCAAASNDGVAADDGAALTATTALATRPTSATATTEKHGHVTIGMLVDPPTGAGWAAPALMIGYADTSHAFGGAQAITAQVTVHLSAPDRHETRSLGLRLDNSGAFRAPFFVDLADIEHVEGVSLSVDGGADTATLGGVRADADDAASVGPFDRVAVRGVTHAASYDGASLALAIDVTPSVLTSEEVPGYDGKGASFALVPHGTAWDRIALGAGHATVASSDRTAIAAKGIAFGITTNMGTIWLQTPTGNLKP